MMDLVGPMPKPAHDPGGKVKLALKAGIKGTARFGAEIRNTATP